MTTKIPLLIFSDAVAAQTGLARIARDLAIRIHEHLSDVYQVATIGYGAATSSRLPFHQYSWAHNSEWIIHDLPEVWYDFAGDRRGVFLSIQDPSRMLWLARPEAACTNPTVVRFLKNRPFEKWGYFPIDAVGANGKLSCVLEACLRGYDKILAYSKWSEKIIIKTIGQQASEERCLDYFPHGIDRTVWYPRGRKFRQIFGELAIARKATIEPFEKLVGIIATNQPRKDFALAMQVCQELRERNHKIRLWIHTDSFDRYWQIPWMLDDYKLLGENIISNGAIDDESMAKLYSACDITLGIGRGEGFGYPIFESLACGTPCIHGNYGGAPEHLPETLKVKPIAYYVEGNFCSHRPVYDPVDWANKVEAAWGKQTELPEHLDWNVLWPKWEQWLRRNAPVYVDTKIESMASSL